MALLDFFGTTPDYLTGLLGSDIDRYRQDANQQALQAAALGLLQAGAPSTTPGGGALAIARGLQMGQQAYKSALREGVQEKLTGLQIQDFLQKQAEQQAVRRFLPNLLQQVPGQELYGEDIMGQRVGVGMTQPTQQINQQSLQQLALAAPEAFGKIATGLKALTPEYKEVNGQLYAIPQFGGTPTPVAGQPKRETITVGNVVLDKNTMQPIYTGTEALPSGVKEYQYAVSQGYPGTFAQFKQEGATKVAVDLKDPTAVAKANLDVMTKWENVLKDSGATEVANRYRALQSSVKQAQSGNANADGAIIYNIGKIYDPSGAVQEGDKKTILGNRSIPQEVKAYAQRVFQGGSLTSPERENLLKVAGGMVQQRQQQLMPQRQIYQDLTRDLGGNVASITDPFAFMSLDSILGGK